MKIKPRRVLPYYVSSDFLKNVNNSSRVRKQGKIAFMIKKILNYFYAQLAYVCPINNLRVCFHKLRGVSIGKNVFIGLRCTLDHAYPNYIYLQDNVILSGDIYIVAHNKPSIHFKKKIPSFVAPVIIEKNCFIGVCCVILPGVRIEEGSFIAGGAVVTKNIPKNSLVRGNPAVVTAKLN